MLWHHYKNRKQTPRYILALMFVGCWLAVASVAFNFHTWMAIIYTSWFLSFFMIATRRRNQQNLKKQQQHQQKLNATKYFAELKWRHRLYWRVESICERRATDNSKSEINGWVICISREEIVVRFCNVMSRNDWIEWRKGVRQVMNKAREYVRVGRKHIKWLVDVNEVKRKDVLRTREKWCYVVSQLQSLARLAFQLKIKKYIYAKLFLTQWFFESAFTYHFAVDLCRETREQWIERLTECYEFIELWRRSVKTSASRW